MTSRRLSSVMTPLWKFFFPWFWILAFSSATASMFFGPFRELDESAGLRWPFLIATLAGATALYWACMRIKRVHLAGNVLLISNYRREVQVPLEEIERVSGTALFGPDLIWLHFRSSTEFGRKIVFMAPLRLLPGLSPHPLVREIEQRLPGASR